MADSFEVTCIIPHATTSGRIQAVGGPGGGGWTMSEDAAIAGIKAGNFTLWTKGGGRVAQVVVIPETNGRSYLKTLADGVLANNLLHLPRCPENYKSIG